MQKLYKLLDLMRISIFLLTIVFLAGCGSSPVKESDAKLIEGNVHSMTEVNKLLYKNALSSMRENKYKSAVNDLKILLTRGQNYPEVWANYALALHHLDKMNELNSALKTIRDKGYVSAQSFNLQGMLLLSEGKFKEAEKSYSQSVKLDSNYAFGWYNLAQINDIYFQNVSQAVKYYERYLALVADDEETRYWTDHLKSSIAGGQ